MPVKATGGAAMTASRLERQNDAIEKQIGLMDADAAAVGTGVDEQERLQTAVAVADAPAERDGVDGHRRIRRGRSRRWPRRYGQAALQAAEAQHKMQQINQASQVLGSAMSNAFADAIIEGKKLNEVMCDLLKTLARAAINAAIMSLFTPGAGGGAVAVCLAVQGRRAAPIMRRAA